MEFNLQTFLTEMRKEINDKIDGLTSIAGDHETRIVSVERAHKTVRWLIGLALVGLFTFLGNVLIFVKWRP